MAEATTHQLTDPQTGARLEVRIETLVLSHFFSNCYIVALPQHHRALVIDPAESSPVYDRLQQRGWALERIVCTHGHLDHSAGAPALRRLTHAPLTIHREDAGYLTNVEYAHTMGFELEPGEPDQQLQEGDEIALTANGGARVTFRVWHTPGHSPGSVTLVADGFCFAGDCLFAGGIGRHDFPGGSATALMCSLKDRILTLPDETIVYPGHGPATTVGKERRTNPFLTGQFDLA